MQNRIINLERLLKKYQFRYGEYDAVVLELKRELDTCQHNIDRLQKSAISNRRNRECLPTEQLQVT